MHYLFWERPQTMKIEQVARKFQPDQSVGDWKVSDQDYVGYLVSEEDIFNIHQEYREPVVYHFSVTIYKGLGRSYCCQIYVPTFAHAVNYFRKYVTVKN